MVVFFIKKYPAKAGQKRNGVSVLITFSSGAELSPIPTYGELPEFFEKHRYECDGQTVNHRDEKKDPRIFVQQHCVLLRKEREKFNY